MTPRERALQWYDDNLSVLADQPKEVRAVVILSVQNAITAAVQAEREACATIAHAEAMKARALGLSQLENPALDIERLIRARSTAQGE